MKTRILAALFILSAATAAGRPAAGSPESSGTEKYRPKIHFSPVTGWMSDPNGMVYYDGEYHLCYQHIPFDDPAHIPWGEMYWGHAVSRDLLNWEPLPIALAPDSLGYIFSGSAVADRHNTSGLGTKENPPLLAVFTYYDHVAAKEGRAAETQSQGLAYSTDRGRTWTKYAGNPILESPGLVDFRDPKIIWYEEGKHWIMAVACGRVIRFYSSPDCIRWEYMSEFGEGFGSHIGPWECPDFFPMRVKGTDQTRWVLLVSLYDSRDVPTKYHTATQYFIGDFDGKRFTTRQRDTLWVDYGRDNYAGVTFDNAPDSRRIFVGWMQSHQYAGGAMSIAGRSWAGAATFPRELSVVRDGESYRLVAEPAAEIGNLYGRQVRLPGMEIDGTVPLSDRVPFAKAPLDISLSFGLPKHRPALYGIRLRNGAGEYFSIEYDFRAGCFRADRTNATGTKFSEPFACVQQAPYRPDGKTMEWRLLVDVASVELFAGENKIVVTDVFYPSEPFDTIELYTDQGKVKLKKGTITELKTIRFE